MSGDDPNPPPSSTEESSRIFVKNLPPSIGEDQLRKHFSNGGRKITDVKLIARRRIAFIGYKSPEEARAAAKYFNRTFIRMSKLSVELAKSISDPSLPTAHKMKRLHEMHASTIKPLSSEAKATEDDEQSKKRKRDLDPATNPKLREFLELMQPQKRGISSTADVVAFMNSGPEAIAANAQSEEAAVAAAVAEKEAESDDEYEALPTRPAKKAKPATEDDDTPMEVDGSADKPQNAEQDAAKDSAIPTEPQPEEQQAIPQPRPDTSATDDDWLRSRTNRLLDLLDPSELAPPSTTSVVPAQAAAQPPVNTDLPADRNNGEEDNIYDDSKDDETNNDIAFEKIPEPTAETATASPDEPLSSEEQILKTSRLFIRNLPYDAKEAHLQKYFETFGAVEEVQLPVTNSGANKGYAMVLYSDPSVALAAFHNADGRTFQGRILHVLPAKAKKTAAALDEFALSKLPLKTQRMLRKKAEAATSSFSWNALFMSQDAVNSAMAERLGMSKSEMLDPTSSDEAVRQAVRQTSLIEETKDYFEGNGVDLDAFKSKTKRGDTAILVKNFAYGTTAPELRKMFEEYGPVVRVLMPPNGTIAIVQFAQPAHGRLAYSKMAYRRVNDAVLMLEKCPESLIASGTGSQDMLASISGQNKKAKLSGSDLLAGEGGEQEVAAESTGGTASLFVRNLNFSTTSAQLTAAFSSLDGFVVARVKTKPDPKAKTPGATLSMGYGFVEFASEAKAAAASSAMDGHILAGHTLTVRASHRGQQDAAATQRAADQAKKLAANRGAKLIIKNIPFEASRQDIRTLLSTYGQLKALRMPKKFGNATRGYAFAEFVTPREAANAMAALRNTHLLGRRLVLEFAEAEAVDPEEEIAKMLKKVGQQVESVEMQQLTTGRRQRTKVHIGEDANGEE